MGAGVVLFVGVPALLDYRAIVTLRRIINNDNPENGGSGRFINCLRRELPQLLLIRQVHKNGNFTRANS